MMATASASAATNNNNNTMMNDLFMTGGSTKTPMLPPHQFSSGVVENGTMRLFCTSLDGKMQAYLRPDGRLFLAHGPVKQYIGNLRTPADPECRRFQKMTFASGHENLVLQNREFVTIMHLATGAMQTQPMAACIPLATGCGDEEENGDFDKYCERDDAAAMNLLLMSVDGDELLRFNLARNYPRGHGRAVNSVDLSADARSAPALKMGFGQQSPSVIFVEPLSIPWENAQKLRALGLNHFVTCDPDSGCGTTLKHVNPPEFSFPFLPTNILPGVDVPDVFLLRERDGQPWHRVPVRQTLGRTHIGTIVVIPPIPLFKHTGGKILVEGLGVVIAQLEDWMFVFIPIASRYLITVIASGLMVLVAYPIYK
jgi:hypothetical protein